MCWAHKDVIIRERISFRTLSATHASHGRVRDLNACGGSNQQAEKHRRSQQHRQRSDRHRCCLSANVGQLCLSMGAHDNTGVLTRHAVLNHWRRNDTSNELRSIVVATRPALPAASPTCLPHVEVNTQRVSSSSFSSSSSSSSSSSRSSSPSNGFVS